MEEIPLPFTIEWLRSATDTNICTKGKYWIPYERLIYMQARELTPAVYWWFLQNCQNYNVWKVSKYKIFSGSYFPVFSPNTRKYGPENAPYLDTFHAVLVNMPDLSEICIPSEHRKFHSGFTKWKLKLIFFNTYFFARFWTVLKWKYWPERVELRCKMFHVHCHIDFSVIDERMKGWMEECVDTPMVVNRVKQLFICKHSLHNLILLNRLKMHVKIQFSQSWRQIIF